MLLTLIPLAWLAIAAFAVVLCRGAANADAVLLVADTENASPRTAPHTTTHQRVPVRYAWRRPGAPAPRASAVRRRGARAGR